MTSGRDPRPGSPERAPSEGSPEASVASETPASAPAQADPAPSSVETKPDDKASPAETAETAKTAPPKDTDRGKPRKRRGRGALAFLRELPVLLLVAFILALLIKTFLIQAFYIPSESMEPTLNIGDRVLVNKVVYHLHPPRRGDIIVFEDPHPTAQDNRNVLSTFWHWLTEGFGVSTNPEKDFIKRVVGLPGDTVAIRHCKVMINGKVLQEPYKHVRDCREYGPHRVPKDNVFVMGDNRPNSSDSRFALRDIPEDKIVGRAFVIIWPPSRWQILRR